MWNIPWGPRRQHLTFYPSLHVDVEQTSKPFTAVVNYGELTKY